MEVDEEKIGNITKYKSSRTNIKFISKFVIKAITMMAFLMYNISRASFCKIKD